MNPSLSRSFAMLAVTAGTASGQEWLERLDDSLHLQTPNGYIRSDLSGLLDLEGYYIDSRPPGLLFPDDTFFFNPRLSLYLDTRIGEHLYASLQVRFDRGFDPGADEDGAARFDEYFLRYTPLDTPAVNLQVGKFATVFGNWVARHDSWSNPFITAPLPYENVFIVSDLNAPPGVAGFLGRRVNADQKGTWLPMIWGPSYATGASVFGALDKFDYAFEFKNASLSSRPTAWDPLEKSFDEPTYGGRIGYRPTTPWNVGVNASYGSYLLPHAAGVSTASLPRYDQLTVGPDLSFEWHHLQIWAEAFASRFEVPNVGDVETLAWYIEAKYKLDAQWFVAARWNQQYFDEIRNAAGEHERWDRDAWRIDASLGYRHSRHIQTKLQYSFNHQNGPFQQGEQLVAAQLTIKF